MLKLLKFFKIFKKISVLPVLFLFTLILVFGSHAVLIYHQAKRIH